MRNRNAEPITQRTVEQWLPLVERSVQEWREPEMLAEKIRWVLMNMCNSGIIPDVTSEESVYQVSSRVRYEIQKDDLREEDAMNNTPFSSERDL